MQKEIILCHFNGLHVEEVFKNIPKGDKWAKTAVRLHNADIVARVGSLDNEVWFLNERINSKCTIHSMDAHGEFIKDDEELLTKLGDYGKQEQKPKGNAKKRSIDEDFNKAR